jgi:hypothetical protein
MPGKGPAVAKVVPLAAVAVSSPNVPIVLTIEMVPPAVVCPWSDSGYHHGDIQD